LSLIPTEQFYEKALASQAAVSRFQWELTKRREFGEEEEAEHRESERDRLDDVVRSKEDKLSELGPLLASILSSTVPGWDNLGVASHGEKREKMSLARLLPPPLYILYTQSQACSKACDKEVLVMVKGDGEEARLFRETKGEDDESQEEGKDESGPGRRSGEDA
jgi:hypothetical protein